jgi:hypothetical protein
MYIIPENPNKYFECVCVWLNEHMCWWISLKIKLILEFLLCHQSSKPISAEKVLYARVNWQHFPMNMATSVHCEKKIFRLATFLLPTAKN